MAPTPIAAVLHELLKVQTFTDGADVLEALKARCARLKIPHDAGTITDAIRLVARTRPILATAPPAPRPQPLERPAPAPVTRAEAAAIVHRLLGSRQIRTMADVVQLDDAAIGRWQWDADQRKAYRLVQALILETARRADALEAALETEAPYGR